MEGTVKILFSSGKGKASGNNGTAINTKTGKSASPISSEQIDRQTIVSNYAFNKAKSVATSITKEWVFYEIDKYLDLTDNVQGQVNMKIAKSLVSKSASALGTIIASSKFGWVGVTVATVGLGVKFGLDLYEGYNDQNIDIKRKNTQLDFTRQRVGYSLTSGDRGENR